MAQTVIKLIDKLNEQKQLAKDEWETILDEYSDDDRTYAAKIAREISVQKFGRKIYLRGIVEFSSFCKNDCRYCGIRRSNHNAQRYRLSEEEILDCCKWGYELGYRTFVFQSGEDRTYSAEKMAEIISQVKANYPDCAITLSIGEMERWEYELMKKAGADRYLLRHETADKAHYEKLHPADMSFEHRMNCLKTLKELGYQTGAGMMVGSPFQTVECLAKDMIFLGEFKPHMIGVGPFLPHKDTEYRNEPKGSYELTLMLLSLCRIMLPDVLLPATTALGTINPHGREEGVLAGANVIMPNISPMAVKKKYMLYDNKVGTSDNSADSKNDLTERIRSIGYEIVVDRGDYTDD